MIEETEDREILGTTARQGAGVGSVTLTEGEKSVGLEAKFQTELTPTQARKLARHLNRMAGRVERRNS